MKNITKIIFHVIVPISIGGIIYLAFRNKSLLMFQWFDALSLNDSVYGIRELLIPYKDFFPDWFIYSLPDGLWVYSFTSALLIIWAGNVKASFLWILIPIFLSIFSEILQYGKILLGTFDIIDVIFCLIASILSILFINQNSLKNERSII